MTTKIIVEGKADIGTLSLMQKALFGIFRKRYYLIFTDLDGKKVSEAVVTTSLIDKVTTLESKSFRMRFADEAWKEGEYVLVVEGEGGEFQFGNKIAMPGKAPKVKMIRISGKKIVFDIL